MSVSRTCLRLRPFATSVFTEMTELALRHDAINLGQGFPDFEGPEALRRSAIAAIESGHNQYCRSAGISELTEAVARHQLDRYGLTYDPAHEITITCGATEALFSSFQGLLEPGDEVLIIEPFYDAYPAGIAAAGGVPRAVTLDSPGFRLTGDALAAAISQRSRAILVNSPHNPSGRVLDREELESVAALAREHDLLVIADEVYERLVFDGAHHPIATLPGMAERTITISSMGKSFSYTGWKVGWACAPAALTAALRTAHQFITFCTPAPFQIAASEALGLGDDYFDPYRAAYRARRDVLCSGLRQAGLEVTVPEGTYFALADIRPLGYHDDVAFCRMLPEALGVAAIPTSAFFLDPTGHRHLVRFAFSKRRHVLAEAMDRLAGLSPESAARGDG